MDKDNIISSSNHSITLNERKNLLITGVKKIDSFDDEEFLLDTSMGYVVIKGEELEIIKLDTFQGNVSIKGKVNSFTYAEQGGKKEKEDSMFSKLFKWCPYKFKVWLYLLPSCMVFSLKLHYIFVAS